MTGGTAAATAQGPDDDDAVNHTPLSTPYHSVADTMMIGAGELKTYESSVSGMGRTSGAPSMTGANCARARSIVAIWGISLAITASCAWSVPGTDAFTFSFGLVSGMRAKSGGRFAPATYSHGPAMYAPRNQRPAISV